MRREELYLADIVDAVDAIQCFLKGVDHGSFIRDDLVRSAVLHKLTVIGEAASHLPKAFQSEHADVPWPDIIGFRNIAIHAYFDVDWEIVWTAATQDAPDLRAKIAPLRGNADSKRPESPTA